MLVMLGCGARVSVTHLGAIPADAHNAWLWGSCLGDTPRSDPS